MLTEKDIEENSIVKQVSEFRGRKAAHVTRSTPPQQAKHNDSKDIISTSLFKMIKKLPDFSSLLFPFRLGTI
jgi:hypothetical protein